MALPVSAMYGPACLCSRPSLLVSYVLPFCIGTGLGTGLVRGIRIAIVGGGGRLNVQTFISCPGPVCRYPRPSGALAPYKSLVGTPNVSFIVGRYAVAFAFVLGVTGVPYGPTRGEGSESKTSVSLTPAFVFRSGRPIAISISIVGRKGSVSPLRPRLGPSTVLTVTSIRDTPFRGSVLLSFCRQVRGRFKVTVASI